MGTPSGVTIVWSAYRIMPIHWLMAWDTAPASYVIDIDPRSRHLTPQIFLSSEAFAPHSFSGPFSRRRFSLSYISLLILTFHYWLYPVWLCMWRIIKNLEPWVWDSFHFSDCFCGFVILLAVSGMDFSRCQLPCSRLIVSDEQHGKCVRCVGLAHARDAIFDISNKTLHARLAFFDWESAVLPWRAAPEAFSLRRAMAWSSDAELEAMESEQFSLSLPPWTRRHSANSLVLFSRSSKPGGAGSRFL